MNEPTAPTELPRLLVLGANGPTGRRTVQQALQRGHHVAALTRHPDAFPLRHDHLSVLNGDATDPTVVDNAVAGTDAVICTIGASFTFKPVDVYSRTAKNLITAMSRHRRRRLIIVTSEGVDETHDRGGRAQRASYTVMRRVFGRTVYDDMATTEALVWGTDLDWTVVRPPGLTNQPGTGYRTAENFIDGDFCARDDLAAMLLDQLTETGYIGRTAAVCSPGLHVSAIAMFRQEILKR